MSNTVKLAVSVAATVIGAGFATGKELQLFFPGNNPFSVVLLLCSLGIMALVSVWFYKQKESGGFPPGIYRFLRLMFLLFAGGSCAVMFACGGETLCQAVSLPLWVGNLLTCFLSVLVVKAGIHRVYRFNLIFSPLLLIALILISGYGLLVPVGCFSAKETPVFPMMLYTGYNLLSVLPFLAALPEDTPLPSVVRGIGLGFFLVALAGVGLKGVLIRFSDLYFFHPLPMLPVMERLHPGFISFYTIVLYLAILTTSVNCLYALCRGKNVAFCSLLLLGLSFTGFTLLMERLYTAFGYAGIFGIGFVILLKLKKKGPSL